MLTMTLRKGPYDIVTASNGEEALEVAAAERPDLILMDVIMPRMTGFEACRELRRRAETRSTPVILLTTRGESDNIETGFGSGCDAYVTKPFNGHELLVKVGDLLAARERKTGTTSTITSQVDGGEAAPSPLAPSVAWLGARSAAERAVRPRTAGEQPRS
jgi:DNA-binding response OmpR family regulator